MFNTQTVFLSSSTSISLSAIAPFQLTINAFNISVPYKIYRIDYDFGDGTSQSVSLYKDSYGDDHNPSLTILNKQYTLLDAQNKTVPIKASVYQIGSTQPTVFNISLNLFTPSLTDIGTGMFGDFHLNSVKMFGPDNDILYIFETSNPRYLLPVLVNWNRRPVIKNIPLDPFYRPYKLLAPFENEPSTPIGIGGEIKNVGVDTAAYQPDNSTY